MKKTHKVVMLPTEKASVMYISEKTSILYSKDSRFINDTLQEGNKPQHLYFLSDDEIKEGDKGWLFEDGRIKSICKFDCTNGLNGIRPTDRKIVATTDKSLHPKCDGHCADNECVCLFPQLPESFIQAYIKAYNEGKPITEVDLEGEEIIDAEEEIETGIYFKPKFEIKTRHDNTVIVHQSKMYSRDEVVKMLNKFVQVHCSAGTEILEDYTESDVQEWIQDNL